MGDQKFILITIFKMSLENEVQYSKNNLKKFIIERESVISKILNTMPDLYIHIDCHNKIMDCFGQNNLNCRLFSDNCIGEDITNIIPKEVLQSYNDAVKRCNETNKLVEKEITINGYRKKSYYECKMVPLINNQFVIVVRDISSRKWIEIALKESEKKYKMIFNICPDYIFIMNKKLNKIIDANPAFLSKYNIHKKELKSLKICDIFNDFEHVDYDNLVFKVTENKDEFDFNCCSKDSNGKIFYLENHCIPVIKNEKIQVVLFFSRDITDSVLISKIKEDSEKNIRMLNEEVEEEKNKMQFFANISHEFKTPINVISSGIQLMDLYAEQIKDNIYTEKLKNLEHNMRLNCYRLTRLVNNLIDMTKIDTGYMGFRPENWDIVDLVKSTCMSIKEYAETKKLFLKFDSNVDNLTIACDVDKIEKIILNLLSNAIKFTNKGDSITVCITYNDNSNLLIAIKDTGIGIEEKDLETIFQRFKQVSKRNENNKDGSGIGLSLVKYLVEMHKGSITVESEVGKGTQFLISLPVYTI